VSTPALAGQFRVLLHSALLSSSLRLFGCSGPSFGPVLGG
jgi:hypothetical protein